ncbi:MAG: V-type ATP synthase subunit F [Candidatus Andersenbacteria bacterium]
MNSSSSPIAYIGPVGAGLGFQLSGIHIEETDDPSIALKYLRQWKQEGEYQIIFIDEALADPNLEIIRSLYSEALPSIMLLPNPSKPTNTASKNLQQLMIRAIGSDIFAS